jgi:hypothetical protein
VRQLSRPWNSTVGFGNAPTRRPTGWIAGRLHRKAKRSCRRRGVGGERKSPRQGRRVASKALLARAGRERPVSAQQCRSERNGERCASLPLLSALDDGMQACCHVK